MLTIAESSQSDSDWYRLISVSLAMFLLVVENWPQRSKRADPPHKAEFVVSRHPNKFEKAVAVKMDAFVTGQLRYGPRSPITNIKNKVSTDQRRHRKREQKMNVNSFPQVLIVYHMIQVLGVIVCGAMSISIKYLSFYSLLLALIPMVLFFILLVASKCKYQDLMVIIVHFNTMLSSLWFITVLPSLVLSCFSGKTSSILNIDYSDTVDNKVLVVVAITGEVCISSAIVSCWGIMTSARDVLHSLKSCERTQDNGVVPVPQPVTCTDCNGLQVGQNHCDEPLLNLS
ncbi:hypothetical protein CHS0354_009228 [Potamilus streckersoni]|uniref:Uncharacterized protein n=1 Tax=Potamilus streckersoni TaxID=2493646 RepID=A0AAE0VRA0_9BIVA|nr:hypothetical protein CHS0354_009228 [Potamilus streckersoni]